VSRIDCSMGEEKIIVCWSIAPIARRALKVDYGEGGVVYTIRREAAGFVQADLVKLLGVLRSVQEGGANVTQ